MKDEAAVQQYGALPWRVSRKGIMKVLLVTSRRGGRWILPKGWQIKGCSPATSAAREAFEEAGVIGLPGSEPIGSYRYVKLNKDGSVEPRNVTVFDFLVRGTLLNWPEKGQRRRKWLQIGQAADAIEESGLARILRSVKLSSGGLPVFAGDGDRDLRPQSSVRR